MLRSVFSYWKNLHEIERFNASDPSWRKLTFYSHSPEDWLILEPIILELLHQFKHSISFVTANALDPIHHMPPMSISPFLVEHAKPRRQFLERIECERLVICNTSLVRKPFPISSGVKNYTFLFPNLMSVTSTLCDENIRAFHTFLCATHSQMRDMNAIQKTFALEGTHNIEVIPLGSTRVDRMLTIVSEHRRISEKAPMVFFAYSNPALEHRDSVCEPIIRTLLDEGYRVIFRPPHSWVDRSRRFLRPLHDAFLRRENYFPDGEQPSNYSIYQSDVLVTDNVELGLELACALSYPVLILAHAERLQVCSFEESMSKILGPSLLVSELQNIAERVHTLLASRHLINSQLTALRKTEILSPGRSALTAAMFLSGRMEIQKPIMKEAPSVNA